MFRDMDLYKAIVLLSVVLLPLGGWLVKGLDDEIEASRRTLQEARKPNGLVEQIGALQRKVEVVVQNKRSTTDAITQPNTYFEGQILAAGGSGIKVSDFNPKEARDEKLTLPGSKQPLTDFVIDIDWRKDLPVTLAFVWAVLWNCETGARAGGEASQQSVWKLRELQLVNTTAPAIFNRNDTPPPELEDKWQIRTLKFARREPRKGN